MEVYNLLASRKSRCSKHIATCTGSHLSLGPRTDLPIFILSQADNFGSHKSPFHVFLPRVTDSLVRMHAPRVQRVPLLLLSTLFFNSFDSSSHLASVFYTHKLVELFLKIKCLKFYNIYKYNLKKYY